MQQEDNNQSNISDDAEDFRYVDKKKEALGCLGMVGEEVVGCLAPIAILVVIALIVSSIAQTCS